MIILRSIVHHTCKNVLTYVGVGSDARDNLYIVRWKYNVLYTIIPFSLIMNSVLYFDCGPFVFLRELVLVSLSINLYSF